MRWDIFCRVIDNFGDVGVCWRLSRSLLARGESVRLWLDDPTLLSWMAPWSKQVPLPSGLTVLPWSQAEVAEVADVPDVREAREEPGDVVIESFGCNLPEAFLARMKHRADAGRAPAWINLEYLSAEGYVERSHGLPSPVMSGPAAGLRKHFFYPGFTPRTGGLLHPLQPVPTSRAEVLALRRQLFRTHPSLEATSPYRFHPWVLLFCYDTAPVGDVLDALSRQAQQSDWPATLVMLAPGAATRLGQRWKDAKLSEASDGPAEAAARLSQHLVLHPLPSLPQHTFDLILQATDLNLVRGEDSAVQALWPGRPHLWQLYVQDDGAHADKCGAFLQRWTRELSDWPPALREQVTAWCRHWNGLAPQGEAQQPGGAPPALPPFPAWWQNPPTAPTPWHAAQAASAEALATQEDLVTQLMAFVKASG